MSMKKKLIITGIVLLIVVGVGYFVKVKQEENLGAKAIHITVIDESKDKTLYDKTIHTDAVTLYEALLETKDLNVVTETSKYGIYMTSMLDHPNEGNIWWVYESATNKECIAYGICPAMDTLNIADKDEFTFLYTSDI